MSRRAALTVAALALATALPFARAADLVDPADESPWKVGIAFGYGGRTNPLVQSDDIPILIDIDIAWFGERWFFDNGDVGRTLVNGERFTLNAIGRVNSDRVFFSKTDTKYVSLFAGGVTTMEPIEVPDRDYAFEVGLELLSDGDWGFFQGAVHRDVSDRHGGYEVYASYGRTFRRQRWFLEPSVGLSFKSEELNDYYWGVRTQEARGALPRYRAESGFNTELRLAASYHIDRHWTFLVSTQYERLNREAARSPLVDERTVRGGFVGISFRY